MSYPILMIRDTIESCLLDIDPFKAGVEVDVSYSRLLPRELIRNRDLFEERWNDEVRILPCIGIEALYVQGQ